MSLVHCRACGEQISDNAKACPKCGEPQEIKKKSNEGSTWLILLLVIIAIGAILYLKTDIFSNSGNKIIIPEGAYVLEKSPDKGIVKILEAVSSNLRGLGDHLTVYGDSVVQSTGALSSLLSNLDGGTTRFKLQKAGTDNQFLLYLSNTAVPLELTNTKELKITINNTALLYQKQ